MIKNFEELLEIVAKRSRKKIVVAGANDRELLQAVKLATDLGIVESILVGDEVAIKALADEVGLKDYQIHNVLDESKVALEGAKLVGAGHGQILMKGLVNTSVYMRAILNRESNLRGDGLLSLMAVYDLPGYHKLLYCTDSGVNVSPDLEKKKAILTNLLLAMKEMGFESPKVAALTANEMVDEKIQASLDARDLVLAVDEGELPECIIEGPIAFDVAFNREAASHKGIESKISGDVDVLMFSNMETGNVLGKSWLELSKATWGGIILGAKKPIVLGSRSDTAEIKLNSIALAALTCKD